MPTESQTIASLRERLPELLPTLDVEVQRPRREDPWDLALKVRAAGTTRRVICEVKSVGEPRIRGIRVVCNTQLYLDLINYPARGREQAEVLRRQKLGY